MFSRSTIALGSVLALTSGAAIAHHSFAMFDNDKNVDDRGQCQGVPVDQSPHLGPGEREGRRRQGD